MPQTTSTELLAQILRSIAFQKRTGMLRIEQLGKRNAEQGEIYFEHGQPIRARAGQEAGTAAIQKISAWKQITCSFSGISRPFPTQTRLLSLTQEAGSQPHPLARRAPERRTETEKLPSASESLSSHELQESKNWPVLPKTDVRYSFTLSPTETPPPVRMNTGTLSAPIERPFILNGVTLEEYAPTQPLKPSRAVQRWTTHVGPQTQIPLPPQSPMHPQHMEPLPGRMAIFKAMTMTATTQALQHMERRERIIFILLDGRRTIQDIARLTHQPEADVEEILVRLAKNGYVQYVQG